MKTAHIVGIVLAVLVVAFLFIYSSQSIGFGAREYVVASTTISGLEVGAEAIAMSQPPPEGTVEYQNDRYGFSFYHWPEGQVKEYDEGGGATTIVLENTARVRGMQIFVVPYTEEKISEARFRADIPSGVRENVENTTIGEKMVPAVTFTSHDMRLGETREVWFIYKGYLYEVTTFKGVGNWFAPVIQSWRFLN